METLVSNHDAGKISIDALSILKRFLRLAFWMVETIELEQFEELVRQLDEVVVDMEF